MASIYSMWNHSDPRTQFTKREGTYIIFPRYLNKFCLNELENYKAGSISIKWKNELPVIGFFFFIIVIFLAINFNLAYPDWLWDVEKKKLKIEAWWVKESHGTHSEESSQKGVSVNTRHTGIDNEVENISGKHGLTTTEILSWVT